MEVLSSAIPGSLCSYPGETTGDGVEAGGDLAESGVGGAAGVTEVVGSGDGKNGEISGVGLKSGPVGLDVGSGSIVGISNGLSAGEGFSIISGPGVSLNSSLLTTTFSRNL